MVDGRLLSGFLRNLLSFYEQRNEENIHIRYQEMHGVVFSLFKSLVLM